jgi:hypothetical protein
MPNIYRVHNGASAAAAAPVKVTTGTSIKTMLQLLHPSQDLVVVEWGVSFDGVTLGTPIPIECELIHTTTVAATVTAYAANDITCLNNASGAAPGLTLSTSGSGYTSSGEGTVVAPVREGDLQFVQPLNNYLHQWPLAQEFQVPAAGVLRIRLTPVTTAVNCYCYVNFYVS